ncbi:ACT domain-containing protein ACR6-like isoform X2 [Camellia sinensis]|uniref:ACT domain-containing protein ACR6-like isoform X2 n=1 Tax=Camellia sinensis TaxID=4442 RepID=UPI001036CE7A|nr:ACT domain-containing protein ACR6-like isoform X2 [Camellia sinensis]
MATPFHVSITAAQVGMYFVGQYYQVLQQQPDFVHQFCNEAGTMLRIDGNSRETATAMLNDHDLSKLVAETPCELLRVVIDNNTCKDATVIQVDSVNKHGILLAVVQVLTNLNLVIRKAYLI